MRQVQQVFNQQVQKQQVQANSKKVFTNKKNNSIIKIQKLRKSQIYSYNFCIVILTKYLKGTQKKTRGATLVFYYVLIAKIFENFV